MYMNGLRLTQKLRAVQLLRLTQTIHTSTWDIKRYCVGQRNETFERFNFNMRVQQEGETVDAYVTALKALAKTCNFGQLQDDLLRDRIVIGIKDNATRKKLLNMPRLTLKKCIDMCRTHESTSIQLSKQ